MKRIAIRKNPRTRPPGRRRARAGARARAVPVARAPFRVRRVVTRQSNRFGRRITIREESPRGPPVGLRLRSPGSHAQHARSRPAGAAQSRSARASTNLQFSGFRCPHESVGLAPVWRLPHSSRGLVCRVGVAGPGAADPALRPRSPTPVSAATPPRPARRKGAAVPRTPTPASRRPRRSEL